MDLERRCVGKRKLQSPAKLSHLADGWDAKCRTSTQQATDTSATDDAAFLDAVSDVTGPKSAHANKPRHSCSMEQHIDSGSVQRGVQQHPSTATPVDAILAAREGLPLPAVDLGTAVWIPGDTLRGPYVSRFTCGVTGAAVELSCQLWLPERTWSHHTESG